MRSLVELLRTLDYGYIISGGLVILTGIVLYFSVSQGMGGALLGVGSFTLLGGVVNHILGNPISASSRRLIIISVVACVAAGLSIGYVPIFLSNVPVLLEIAGVLLPSGAVMVYATLRIKEDMGNSKIARLAGFSLAIPGVILLLLLFTSVSSLSYTYFGSVLLVTGAFLAILPNAARRYARRIGPYVI